MVVPVHPPPPGCPEGWPIKLTAQSGVQIVWGPPHSRQPPGDTRFRGIGIKMQSVPVPGYPEHSESWAGLYEQKLHELFWRFRVLSQPDACMLDLVLHLPMMGMPPREPTEEMLKEVRAGQKYSSFFEYATVVKATDINTSVGHQVYISETAGPGNDNGDDVVIRLPPWPKAPPSEDSLYRRTMDTYGFEFRTHLPEYDTCHDSRNVDICRLYFIQLLPNELPSYHFWARPTDQPWLLRDNRKRLDHPGSPHYDDSGASYKQTLRLSPRNSGAPLSPSRPSGSDTGSRVSPKRPRSGNNGSSSSNSGPAIKKLKTIPTPEAKGKGNENENTTRSKAGKSSRRIHR